MRVWLAVVYLMILVMVCIGGITRLTGSGLSMVEWHPLMGALPPLNEAAWNDVFTRYQSFPQYQEVNQWMTLADFKRIFFWEYLHRLFGRLIGVVAFVPWLVFLVRKKLDRGLAAKTLLLIVLGGFQGVLGWYMVRSGLVHRPEVSHLRLAAHLSLAFVVALYALWLLLGLRERTSTPAPWGEQLALWGAVALVALQTVYGAFMAGTRAGWLASTYPDMHGHYLPGVFLDAQGWTYSLLHAPMMIHWVHRALGLAALLVCIAVALPAVRSGRRAPALAVIASVSLQFLLGSLTVIWSVPIIIAVLHQANALLLASALIWLIHDGTETQ